MCALRFRLFFFTCVYMYGVQVTVEDSASYSQKLELQVVVSHLMWVLGTELSPLQEQYVPLKLSHLSSPSLDLETGSAWSFQLG